MALAIRCGLRHCAVSITRRACPGTAVATVAKRTLLWSKRPSETRVYTRAATEDSTAATLPPANVEYVEVDKEFSLTKISFGQILTPIGSVLLVAGFATYVNLVPGAESGASSLLLVYGFIMALLGFALIYAQLEPVPCKTSKLALELRATQMTDIQKQVREDCTRFRYGDEQHLEEALDKIFRFNKAGGLSKRLSPKLIGLREEVSDGMYALVLEFQSSVEAEKWLDRQAKFQSFFGPGIVAQMQKTPRGMDVWLVTDGSGKGRGGGEKKDVLPPLMPGLKARQQ